MLDGFKTGSIFFRLAPPSDSCIPIPVEITLHTSEVHGGTELWRVTTSPSEVQFFAQLTTLLDNHLERVAVSIEGGS